MNPLDRRNFAKLSALALAATRLPAAAQSPHTSPTGAPTFSKPVGFAAVGLGTISDIFSQACALTPNARVTGIVTGHAAEKAPRYQQQFHIPDGSVYNYQDYDKIRDNPAIEAVYIGLPNSMHCEYTIRAAEAGKHVLCEKPMAISSAECRKMIDACKRANVHLMIAYRVHYDPTWQKIREIARSGAIGQIQGFQGGFYGPSMKGWRLDRKLSGGGSLMDLGIYPMNTLRWIAGEEATAYRAFVSTMEHSARFEGPNAVEETIEFMMKFPSGILASAGSSYGMDGPCTLTIDGSHGHIRAEPAFFYTGLKYTGMTKDGPIEGASSGKGNPYQFVYEADHFASCVRNNTTPATPGEEGLADMLAMEAIYRAAGAPIA